MLFLCTSTSGFAISLSEKQNIDYIRGLMHESEQKYGIPSGILMAIAKVESGLKIYGLNINGKAHIAKSKNEAIKTIMQNIKSGISNIDIGVMQINYKWHGEEFKSVEDMLNPYKNIDYAAFYLKSLKDQHGSWRKAIRYYHSPKPILGLKYSKKVILTWLKRRNTGEARNV